MFFTVFGCLFVGEKFLLTSIKSLTNSEIPSLNPLQEACSGFQKPPMTLKVVQNAAYDSF